MPPDTPEEVKKKMIKSVGYLLMSEVESVVLTKELYPSRH